MTIDTKLTKEHGYRMSLTVLISYLPLIPVFWLLVKPVLVTAVSEAVAADIQNEVKAQVAPLNQAFIALTKQKISSLRKEIAREEFRKTNNSNWTVEDAEDLVELREDLEAQREALAALRGTG
ncbi:hypothetical protein LCGC14_0865660 [marine sediment metagenome]|uniref:Uncharacterized protein n=1 Tax=marine sediment metagenome TaxID=412755 RepID=A0A0F9RQU5_9ZZZZ